MAVSVTKPAPEFTANAVVNGEFKKVSLADYRGKYVIFFFYPLDFTFVCPTEIIAFSDRIADFEKRGVQVIGCSVDSRYSHLAWINTPRAKGGLGELKYPLVEDLTKKISSDYGVLLPDGIALRGLFFIDKEGVVRHVTINDLPLGRSVDEALRVIDAFQHFEKHGEVCPADWKPGKDALNPKKANEYFEKAAAKSPGPMSYRTFRRLLGETNLERKCRWLLGLGTLVLMMASFVLFARLTEGVAYDQLTHTGRALVGPTVAARHLPPDPALNTGLGDLLPPTATSDDPAEEASLRAITDAPGKAETQRKLPNESVVVYYAAVRAEAGCVACHSSTENLTAFLGNRPDAASRAAALARPELAEGDLLGVVRVRMPTEGIEDGVHANRAWMIAFAVATTILILIGTYLIVRYVVVKPVKALKGTADAIASGDLSVRSDLHTGDEFEDLSRAFNRMLANLIRTQERNRGLIAELDGKVDELAQINLELHRTNAVKTEFLSTVSHELRTPLNSIIGFSETLLGADNLSEKQLRWVANVHDNGKTLLALINDVLDLAKVESGKMRVRVGVVAVPALCDELAGLVRQQAEKKDIELVVAVPPDTPDVRQDAGKLRQIGANLLSNAVKFTPDGGRVTLRAWVDGESFVLQVADTGVGIAPEHQETVFQKFRQTGGTLTREQTGTGLGLSIVRELARLLGGDVTLTSAPGRGSTFTVTVSARLKDDPLAAFSAE